ncbi:MAG: SMC-Scp complex subunit ScpB [bacterium]
MADLKSQIESLLFVAAKQLSLRKIVELTESSKGEVKKVLQELMKQYQQEKKGVQIVKNLFSYQMTTAAENGKLIKKFLKDEISGELTQPSLEALTIIAYRGPITKIEIEKIRGVNCSLILRNLMMRGLVEAHDGKNLKKEEAESNYLNSETYYNLTFDFLRYLGLSETSDLPDYEKLRNNENLEKLLGAF